MSASRQLTSVDLWWRTLFTIWGDWDAVRVTKSKDGKRKLQRVDVAALKRRKRALQAAVTVGIGAALYWKWPVILHQAKEIGITDWIKQWQ